MADASPDPPEGLGPHALPGLGELAPVVAEDPPVSGTGRHARTARRLGRWPAALAAAIVAAVVEHRGPHPLTGAAVVFVVFAVAAFVSVRLARGARLLPLVGALARRAAPAGAVLALLGLHAAARLDVPPPSTILLCGLAAILVAELAARLGGRIAQHAPRTRVAVIGSSRSADALERELRLAQSRDYVVVGRIVLPDEPPAPHGADVPSLGPLDELGPIIERHGVQLLLLTGNAPRMAVFDEVAASCLGLPVRLRELAGFYEETFGHVPVAEINAAWFQYLMHPSYNAGASWLRRVVDVVIAVLLGIAFLPILAVVAVLIRLDGGPVFFRQPRIGEGGRRFDILKLRTMRPGASNEWTEESDPRITRVGRFLRGTHLDELPQVINILRGEMSVVGPRPEQPEFVDRLERIVPFYQRRHLVKPGLTGWAQVRCGYAGSDVGSAWKVCHDLYYLKHRSLLLDILIVGETLRTLFADRQYTAEPLSVAFILARTEVEPARAGA
jgi:exopolysaccharide biosynthesis polyprenyl glycosylphosphotransferase